MRSESDIRLTISELNEASLTWVESNYTTIVNLFRAQIKGLKYALGEEYNIHNGVTTRMAPMRSESEIRKRISVIEKEANEYYDQENILRLMRAQIKGLKLALGETYSIAEGK